MDGFGGPKTHLFRMHGNGHPNRVPKGLQQGGHDMMVWYPLCRCHGQDLPGWTLPE